MSDKCTLPDFAAPLLAWYDTHARDLPWRRDKSPYRVWVSEIMLQQTRVEAVKPYFARFMEALPTIEALADCDPERLNKLWEGLGYYSRVRNMKRAAEVVVRDFGGCLPRDYAQLLALPGIGSYTAGAIASFAYDLPAAAVDGNVLRVLSRVTGDKRNIQDPAVKRDYEEAIRAVIPAHRPGDYNQALIEVGATVCGPNVAPDCAACPLRAVCRAHHEGTTDVIPHREKKKERRREERTILLIRDGTHTLLHRRPAKGLLAGLYEFPSMAGHAEDTAVLAYVRSLGLEPIRVRRRDAAKHIFTHIEWHMIGYTVTVADAALPANTPLILAPGDAEKPGTAPCFTQDKAGDYVFADTAALADTYALPSAFSAYA